MTRRVAAAGYVGIAPQFYHREGEPKTPEETANFKNTRRDINVLNDINATINFLKGCANADTSRLGIVGFCMGGRIAFLAAAATSSFKAAVDFYGGGTYRQWGDRARAGDPCGQRLLPDSRPLWRARQKSVAGRNAPARRRADQARQSA